MLKCENCIHTCNLGGIQSRFFVWRLRIPIHDVWIVWSLWYVDSTPSLAHSDVSYTTGSYPCLYCLIPNKNMATPLPARGHAPPRSLQSIHTYHQKYLASGGVRKKPNSFIIVSVNPSLTSILNRYSVMICMLMYLHCTKIDLPTWPSYHYGDLYKALSIV